MARIYIDTWIELLLAGLTVLACVGLAGALAGALRRGGVLAGRRARQRHPTVSASDSLGDNQRRSPPEQGALAPADTHAFGVDTAGK